MFADLTTVVMKLLEGFQLAGPNHAQTKQLDRLRSINFQKPRSHWHNLFSKLSNVAVCASTT
jgi:hypothetical protein